jgi:hypothetical protein
MAQSLCSIEKFDWHGFAEEGVFTNVKTCGLSFARIKQCTEAFELLGVKKKELLDAARFSSSDLSEEVRKIIRELSDVEERSENCSAEFKACGLWPTYNAF